MNTFLLRLSGYLLLVVGLTLSQLAGAQTNAKISYFDGRTLTAGSLHSVQISMPGLFDPSTGKQSTRADFERPIVIQKVSDHSSPILIYAYHSGYPIKEITIQIEIPASTKGGQTAHMSYKLTNIMVTSYSTSADGDEEPLENITLSFSKCEILYK